MRKLTGPIDPRWVEKAIESGACLSAIWWLEKRPRTWEELRKEKPEWYVWALSFIPELPLDLMGLCLHELAQVMAHRPDYRIDLTGMNPHDRARVMAARRDCKICLTGMGSFDRAWVMINRPDCPVSYKGLTREDARLVYEERTRKGWDCPPLPDWMKLTTY